MLMTSNALQKRDKEMPMIRSNLRCIEINFMSFRDIMELRDLLVYIG